MGASADRAWHIKAPGFSRRRASGGRGDGRGGQPYYRHGNYGYNDRLVVVRDRWGRPTYYRNAPRRVVSRNGPPYGNAYGYYANGPGSRNVNCKKNGRCEVRYYDPRYDRKRWDRDDRYDRRDRRHGRRWHDDD